MNRIIDIDRFRSSDLLQKPPTLLSRLSGLILWDFSRIINTEQRVTKVLILNMKLCQQYPNLKLVELRNTIQNLNCLLDHQQRAEILCLVVQDVRIVRILLCQCDCVFDAFGKLSFLAVELGQENVNFGRFLQFRVILHLALEKCQATGCDSLLFHETVQ